MRFILATHNVSHDGTPDRADLVLTQETNPATRLDGFERFRPAGNPQLSINSRPHVFTPIKSGLLRLHAAGRAFGLRNFGPPRGLAWQLGYMAGRLTIVATAHLVNSAWAPEGKPTTHRRLRRRLWRRAYRRICKQLRAWHAAGYLVFLAGDFNRPRGRWGFPGMVEAGTGRLDRIFHTDTPAIRVLRTWDGNRTGTGRVTHRSRLARFQLSPVSA